MLSPKNKSLGFLKRKVNINKSKNINERFYIIPIRGNGLWNAIWGYISLKNDLNTIKGVSFDHKGETAGLGAEITKDWFQESFIDEKVFNNRRNRFIWEATNIIFFKK